ncbi:MAG TPA: NAD-dependent epimerase/dehydratase family protein [Methylocystis sp.]|nr:NAD-dependent epimerase/dehydratase family protein [Methylocystis sp.]
MISSAFWLGKRIFVTGHTGFMGSWFSLTLSRLNAVSTGYALEPPTTPSLFDLARVGEHIEDIRGDIRDLSRLRAAMKAAEPEIVIHLAEPPQRPEAQEDRRTARALGLMDALNALEAARACGSVAVALVVSDGDDEGSSAAFRGGVMKILSARSGETIGGGDFASGHIAAEAFRAFSSGRPLSLRNPHSQHPWVHVMEPVAGCLELVETAMSRDARLESPWSFAPEPRDERSAEAFVARFRETFGAGDWISPDDAPPPDALSPRKKAAEAGEVRGWSPTLDFVEAVDWTAQWWRALAFGEDVARITRAQVDAYLGRRVRLVSPFAQPKESERGKLSRAVGF